MTSSPARPTTGRYRLPTRPPLRLLLMASLSATVGSLEVVVWAVLGSPAALLQAGVVLLVVGAALAFRALVVHRRLGWTLQVGPTSLTIIRGSRQDELPWSSVREVRLVGPQLVITGTDHERPHVLPVPPEASGSAVLGRMIEAVQSHVPSAT